MKMQDTLKILNNNIFFMFKIFDVSSGVDEFREYWGKNVFGLKGEAAQICPICGLKLKGGAAGF